MFINIHIFMGTEILTSRKQAQVQRNGAARRWLRQNALLLTLHT